MTKWTKACDKRLNRLISYIHHTCEYKQYCHVGNTAKQCRLGLFKTPILREILKILNPLLEEHCACLEVILLFQQVGCVKKQTAVSHSSTESETISLDTGLRLDGLPFMEVWDLIVSVLGDTIQNHDRTERPVVNKREACSPPHTIHKRKQSQRVINDLDNVDFIPSNVPSSHQEALLYVFEDNEEAIKMIIRGRSPTLIHVSRTHRVALDWLFDRINLHSKIQIKYIDTRNQLADTNQGKFHTWWMESSLSFV